MSCETGVPVMRSGTSDSQPDSVICLEKLVDHETCLVANCRQCHVVSESNERSRASHGAVQFQLRLLLWRAGWLG